MKEIYIHIGLHKTGTTWLQRVVFPQLQTVNYIPRENISRIVTEILMHDPSIFDEKTVMESLECYLVEGKNLFSSESFSGLPFLQYVNRSDILKKIHMLFPNAKIIICIRSQIDILCSLFAQFVRLGGVKKFSKLINPPQIFNTSLYDYLNLDMFKYSVYLREIERLFSRENVYICLYENLHRNYELFLDGLLGFLKEEKCKIQFENKRYNRSPSDSELYVGWLLNRIFKSTKMQHGLPRLGRSYSYLVRIMAMPLGNMKRWYISDRLEKYIKEYFRRNNHIMDERYQLGIQKVHAEKYF